MHVRLYGRMYMYLRRDPYMYPVLFGGGYQGLRFQNNYKISTVNYYYQIQYSFCAGGLRGPAEPTRSGCMWSLQGGAGVQGRAGET